MEANLPSSITSNVFTGNTSFDSLIVDSDYGLGGTVLPCGHDANCEFGNLFNMLRAQASTSCPAQKTFTRKHPRGQPTRGGGGGGTGSGFGNGDLGANGGFGATGIPGWFSGGITGESVSWVIKY